MESTKYLSIINLWENPLLENPLLENPLLEKVEQNRAKQKQKLVFVLLLFGFCFVLFH